MTTDNIIDLLIIAFGIPFVWALAVTLALWDERRELKKLHKSKEELRDSMNKTNYRLQQQLDRMASEIYNLRVQNRQLQEQQKQDN